ncbi:MAG TPA: PEGA domain-containing protein [Terriglobales bacterium]|nr:PEGA domain-containing protein [Terriglobales bacterium]
MSCLRLCLIAFLLLVSTVSLAKKPDLIMMWPQENSTLKLTFGTFRELATYNGKTSLASDVVVQNLTTKAIPRASLTVSLLDKNKVRIGSGLLIIEDLTPGQSAKIQFQCFSVGLPVMLNLAAYNGGGVPTSTRTTSVTIISVPPGASLKVDGQAVGVTPTTVRVLSGTHNLDLHKDGFADATTPLDVNVDEAPGGSITITLGGIANDTIELRDGSILMGDVISMSLESVIINIRGSQQTFERNKIKKMFLVERTVTHTSIPVTPAQPNPVPVGSATPHQ